MQVYCRLSDITRDYQALISRDVGPWWVVYLVFIAALPAIFFSFVFPALAPLGVLASGALIFDIMNRIQPALFDLDQMSGFLWASTPVLFLFLGWAALLVQNGEPLQVARTVGPIVLLTTTGLSPVYRFRQSRKQRIVPFNQSYPIWALLVAVQQIMIVRSFMEV